MLRTNLGDEYVDGMFKVWDDRVPREADLCCYWFEKGRQMIERSKVHRVGLLATQGIRGGANREVLNRIKNTGDIFFAESDRNWILDGANVHVSMVGYDDGTETTRRLDGSAVAKINANLGGNADTTTARRLSANLRVSFMGDTKGGAFDIPDAIAITMLQSPNPHGKPNSDVVMPWVNGLDLTRRSRSMWIIDFGIGTPVESAARYEQPFAHVEREVRPERAKNNRDSYREKWWIHVEPRPAMRPALLALRRFLVTIGVSKHRLFTWMTEPTLPDHQLFVFARADDSFFGVLHSRVHEVWARAPGMGTQVRERESGFRYTATSCFETFPLPVASELQDNAIGVAAQELDELRKRWLNPREWTREEILEFPGSVGGPWRHFVENADGNGI